MGFIKAAELNELQPGQVKMVAGEGREIALCNEIGRASCRERV